MAMITCVECGKSISDKAKICVKCGCPMDEMYIKPKEDIINILSEATLPLKGISIYDEVKLRGYTGTQIQFFQILDRLISDGKVCTTFDGMLKYQLCNTKGIDIKTGENDKKSKKTSEWKKTAREVLSSIKEVLFTWIKATVQFFILGVFLLLVTFLLMHSILLTLIVFCGAIAFYEYRQGRIVCVWVVIVVAIFLMIVSICKVLTGNITINEFLWI